MPEVVVYAVEGRTPEQKKLLMQKITAAVHETFGAPLERIVVQVVESKADNKSRGGVLYSER